MSLAILRAQLTSLETKIRSNKDNNRRAASHRQQVLEHMTSYHGRTARPQQKILKNTFKVQ